jgi:fatty-acid desaturase
MHGVHWLQPARVGCLRPTPVWHTTRAVNSVTHYRNYDTGDSRNHWLVALVANGEGWHNNHHADQRAAHGHRWWEGYNLRDHSRSNGWDWRKTWCGRGRMHA